MSSAFEGLPKTPNLKLNKPGYDNVADIEALNENADILDAEIQGIKNTFVKSVNGINAGDGGNVDLGIIPIAKGGTGATTAANARTNLGLGNVAALNTVPIANGGTGATTAKQARENLELGNMALKDNAIANATISGKVITLTFADGTTKTLTTQDTAPARYITSKSGDANSWLVVYNDGWVEQGGRLNANYNATVTYNKAFAITPTLLISTVGTASGTVGQDRYCVQKESATGFTVGVYHATYTKAKSWYACGYGA